MVDSVALQDYTSIVEILKLEKIPKKRVIL